MSPAIVKKLLLGAFAMNATPGVGTPHCGKKGGALRRFDGDSPRSGLSRARLLRKDIMYHTPVLLESVLEYLALHPGATVVDATLGDGGHAEAMLSCIGERGRLLGIDASPTSLGRAKERLQNWHRQVVFVHGNFAEIEAMVREADMERVDAILMDLGIASWQLDQPQLGLSFRRNEPLDMRLHPGRPTTAAQILAQWPPNKLETLFETYGDIPRARTLVRKIVENRSSKPILTTDDLVAIVGTKAPKALAPIFQALRIAVNDELVVLTQALESAMRLIQPTGRLVVISYHSGEDRIVKTTLKEAERSGIGTILTPKPVTPAVVEQQANSRSRSAKLRAFTATKV